MLVQGHLVTRNVMLRKHFWYSGILYVGTIGNVVYLITLIQLSVGVRKPCHTQRG